MATPSLAMIPSAYADSKVYSVLPNNGDGDFTFDRASTATRVGQNGLIETVATDIPRLNYDISNGVVQSCPSLLLEPASTNLLTYSEDFSQYSQTNITVADNNSTSPEGIVNSSKLTDDSTNGNHRIFLSHTTTAASHTFSIFMKKGTMTTAFLRFLSGSDIAGANVDLEAGTISATAGTAKIEAYPNDWYKCSITGTAVSGTSYVYVYMKQLAGYSGTSQDMFIFGAQVEALSYASSYIPTAGSSQTRAAETCGDAGTASTFNSTEGVLYFEGSALADDGTNRYFSLDDGTTSNYIYFRYVSTSNNVLFRTAIAGVTINTLTVVLSDTTQNHKFAYKWKSGDYALWVDGVEISTDSSATTFPSNTLNNLGFNFPNSTGGFYANTKDVRVYNEALTDAQLQTLTTL